MNTPIDAAELTDRELTAEDLERVLGGSAKMTIDHSMLTPPDAPKLSGKKS
jgi:hypothetical protein